MASSLAQRLRPDRSFERIYERHVADVYRYTLAVLRNPSDAEDVTQTTFMNAFRAYSRGERPRSARNWLIAIAHNVCRQRFRQSQRRVEEVGFDENVAESLVRDDEGPTVEDIQRALGHLAFNQRSALVMRELEGRSYAEIAEILDVTPSAVETLIFRARRALREQLEGSLTCPEAELAISRQLDGRLPRSDRGRLRAHLRECGDCAALARRQRAQRSAIKALAAVPLPSSLTALGSLFGGGGAAAGGSVALKAAAVVAAGTLAGGGVYEGAKRLQAAEPAAKPPVRVGGLGEGVRASQEVPRARGDLPVVARASAARPIETLEPVLAAKPKPKPKAKPKPKQKLKEPPPRGRALGRIAAWPTPLAPARIKPEPPRSKAPVRPSRPARAKVPSARGPNTAPGTPRGRPKKSLPPKARSVARGLERPPRLAK